VLQVVSRFTCNSAKPTAVGFSASSQPGAFFEGGRVLWACKRITQQACRCYTIGCSSVDDRTPQGLPADAAQMLSRASRRLLLRGAHLGYCFAGQPIGAAEALDQLAAGLHMKKQASEWMWHTNNNLQRRLGHDDDLQIALIGVYCPYVLLYAHLELLPPCCILSGRGGRSKCPSYHTLCSKLQW
jgi:hypothetical protein